MRRFYNRRSSTRGVARWGRHGRTIFAEIAGAPPVSRGRSYTWPALLQRRCTRAKDGRPQADWTGFRFRASHMGEQVRTIMVAPCAVLNATA